MTPKKLIYRHFLIVFTVLFLSLHCMQIHSQQTPTNQKTTAQARTEITTFKVDSILSLMTLKEKISMCHAQSQFSSPGIPRLGIPELWMSDGPHGIRAEINWSNWGYSGWTNDYITAFPALTCLSATFNPSLSKQYGVSIGEEARYRKKDVLLGKVRALYSASGRDEPFGLGMAKVEVLQMHYDRARGLAQGHAKQTAKEDKVRNVRLN